MASRDRPGTRDIAPFVPLQLAMPHTNIFQPEHDTHSLFVGGSCARRARHLSKYETTFLAPVEVGFYHI